MMSKNSIVPFLKDYLIKFLTRPFLLDTNEMIYLSGSNRPKTIYSFAVVCSIMNLNLFIHSVMVMGVWAVFGNH